MRARNRVAALSHRAASIVREKRRVDVSELAWELGYSSVEYFKRSVLPMITTIHSCIEYVPRRQEVVWVCDDGEGVEAGARG